MGLTVVSFADMAWYNLDMSLATTFPHFILSVTLDVCNFTILLLYGFKYARNALMYFSYTKNAFIFYSGMFPVL